MFGLIVDPRKFFVHNAVREVSDIAYFDETKVLFFSEASFFNKTFFSGNYKTSWREVLYVVREGLQSILPVKLLELRPAQQGIVPNFVRIQKRRRSLHLPKRGYRLPQCDKHKRPTPQTGCCPWPYDQEPVEKPVTTNRGTPQNGIPA